MTTGLEPELVVTGMLVFGRVSGLMAALPAVSAEGVPKAVPVLGAVAITAIVAPTAPATPVPPTLLQLSLSMCGELALGLLAASALAAVFGAIGLAGEVMSMQMGLAMATIFNPLLKGQSSSVGVVATWLAGAVLLGLGVHREALELVGASFHGIPPGSVGLDTLSVGVPVLLDAVAHAILLGTQLAGPILAMVWLVNVFIAILAKLAPRMNVFFSLGMTLSSTMGLVLFGLSLGWLLTAHAGHLVAATRYVRLILGG